MKRIPDTARVTVSSRQPKPLVKKIKQLAIKNKVSVSTLTEILYEEAVKRDSIR